MSETDWVPLDGLFSKIERYDFDKLVSDENSVYELIAGEKWKDGFICRHCGHDNYCKGKTPFSRRCTRCKREESATASTVFHRCKIDIKEAFKIAYMVCHAPEISTYEISRRMEIRQMTCWKFKKKIMECLEERQFSAVPKVSEPQE
ncbi:MAG: transposase [Bacteroidales bacterium]